MSPKARPWLLTASRAAVIGNISVALNCAPSCFDNGQYFLNWEAHGMLVSWSPFAPLQITRQNASMDWQRVYWIVGYCYINGIPCEWPS